MDLNSDVSMMLTAASRELQSAAAYSSLLLLATAHSSGMPSMTATVEAIQIQHRHHATLFSRIARRLSTRHATESKPFSGSDVTRLTAKSTEVTQVVDVMIRLEMEAASTYLSFVTRLGDPGAAHAITRAMAMHARHRAILVVLRAVGAPFGSMHEVARQSGDIVRDAVPDALFRTEAPPLAAGGS